MNEAVSYPRRIALLDRRSMHGVDVLLLSVSVSNQQLVEKSALPVGESNPVFRVTGGDTVHYTNEDGG